MSSGLPVSLCTCLEGTVASANMFSESSFYLLCLLYLHNSFPLPCLLFEDTFVIIWLCKCFLPLTALPVTIPWVTQQP